MLIRPMANAHAFPRLRSEMDQLFERFFGDYEPYRAWDAPGPRRTPAVNVWQDAETMYVEAELPGLTTEELDLAVAGDELIIKGTRGAPELAEGTVVHRRERGVGTFTRIIPLPFAAAEDRVDATFLNGVLTVTLPKAVEMRPRRVPVKTFGLAPERELD